MVLIVFVEKVVRPQGGWLNLARADVKLGKESQQLLQEPYSYSSQNLFF